MIPKIKYSEEKIDLLFTGIYTGAVNVYHLPKHLYLATAEVLLHAFTKGTKQQVHNKKKSIYTGPDKKMLEDLKTNIYHFSAAKTFHQVLEFQELMVENNSTIDLEKFKKKAFKKWNSLNIAHLEAEYTTTLTASVSAMNWDYANQNIDIFPRMKAVAIIDAQTAPECFRMNGIIADVGDPIWNHNISPRHFNCRCHEELIDKYDPVKSSGAWDKKRAMRLNDESMAEPFKLNPGKDRQIFKEKQPGRHPYFVVSKKYQNLKKNNFNLPIPRD